MKRHFSTYCLMCVVLLIVALIFSSCTPDYEEEKVNHVHEWGQWMGHEATCTTAGDQQRWCIGMIYDGSVYPMQCMARETKESPALGHYWGTATNIIKQPNCTEPGTGTVECTRCDVIDTGPDNIPVRHIWGSIQTSAPSSCTSNGTGYKYCTVCNLREDLVISALGHAWVSVPILGDLHRRQCSRCGQYSQ